MTELQAINYTITLLACVQPSIPSKKFWGEGRLYTGYRPTGKNPLLLPCRWFRKKYLIVLTINMATLSRGGKPRIDHTDKNYTNVGNLRTSRDVAKSTDVCLSAPCNIS